MADNPLFETWAAWFEPNLERNYWSRGLEFHIGPDTPPEAILPKLKAIPAELWEDEDLRRIGARAQSWWAMGHALRTAASDRWAWAVPDDTALNIVSAFSPLVEVGAGRGYWAALLASLGADIICFDSNPPHGDGENHWARTAGIYHPVHQAYSEVAAPEYPGRTLFVCWPNYGDPAAAVAVHNYRLAGGTRLVYVGEGHGGCCGDDSLFTELDDRWVEVLNYCVPQWDGIHDWLSVYEPADPPMLNP